MPWPIGEWVRIFRNLCSDDSNGIYNSNGSDAMYFCNLILISM
jgi:hypothetical protein